MTIDKPTGEHIAGLRRLWQQAFGDTDAFLDGFFKVGFAFDRCRCIRLDGCVAAALYWFDCTWGKKKVAYLYAVATDDAFRGKGLCRALMEDTHRHLRNLGYAGAVLVPVDRDLIDMYAKFGYRCFCPLQKATSTETLPAKAISAEEYRQLRHACLGENAILQGITPLQLLDIYGGFYQAETAVFCGYFDNGTFHFEEILGQLPARREAFSEAMYLPLDNDDTLPTYFGIPLN